MEPSKRPSLLGSGSHKLPWEYSRSESHSAKRDLHSTNSRSSHSDRSSTSRLFGERKRDRSASSKHTQNAAISRISGDHNGAHYLTGQKRSAGSGLDVFSERNGAKRLKMDEKPRRKVKDWPSTSSPTSRSTPDAKPAVSKSSMMASSTSRQAGRSSDQTKVDRILASTNKESRSGLKNRPAMFIEDSDDSDVEMQEVDNRRSKTSTIPQPQRSSSSKTLSDDAASRAERMQVEARRRQDMFDQARNKASDPTLTQVKTEPSSGAWVTAPKASARGKSDQIVDLTFSSSPEPDPPAVKSKKKLSGQLLHTTKQPSSAQPPEASLLRKAASEQQQAHAALPRSRTTAQDVEAEQSATKQPGTAQSSVRPSPSADTPPKPTVSQTSAFDTLRKQLKESEDDHMRQQAELAKAAEQKRERERREADVAHAAKVKAADEDRCLREAQRDKLLKNHQESEQRRMQQLEMEEQVKKDLQRQKEEQAKLKAERQKAREEERIRLDEVKALEQQRLKEERIKKQQERNAALHAADEEDDREMVVEEHEPKPIQPTSLARIAQQAFGSPQLEFSIPQNNQSGTTTGPRPLNSLEGQAAVAKTNQQQNKLKTSFLKPTVDKLNAASQTPQATPVSAPRKPSYGRQLFPILLEDALLLGYRDKKIDWPEVIQLLATRCRKPPKSLSTIQNRARQLQNALQEGTIDRSLLARVAESDEGAGRRINEPLNGEDPTLIEEVIPTPQHPQAQVETSTNIDLTAVGEITVEDAKLFRRKVSGHETFGTIRNLLFQEGGTKSEDELKARFQVLKSAVDQAGISHEAVFRVADGDVVTRRQVNTKVHGHDFALPTPKTTPIKIRLNPRDPLQAVIQQPEEQPRPTTGGKTLNADYYKWLYDSLVKSNEDDDDATLVGDDDQGSIGEDPYHFVYHVLRRDLTNDEVEDDYPDPDLWIECGDGYLDPVEANCAASREVYRTVSGRESITSGAFGMEKHDPENGMDSFTLYSKTGQVDVTVTRDLKFNKGRKLVATDASLAPRSLWVVMQRTMTEQRDEVLDEVTKTIETAPDASSGYTDLDLANGRAIELFVKLTVKPITSNLGEWQLRKNELTLRLSEGIVVDEPFAAEMATETDVVKVWVEKGSLIGPRNL